MVITVSEYIWEARWYESLTKYMILRLAEGSLRGSPTFLWCRISLWAALASAWPHFHFSKDLNPTLISSPLFFISASRTWTTSSRLLTSTTRQLPKQRPASGKDFTIFYETFTTLVKLLWQHPVSVISRLMVFSHSLTADQMKVDALIQFYF